MSTKIQINSLEALERLIGNDNELEIQIRQSVVQDFTRKHLKSLAKLDLIENIGRAVKEEVEKEFFDVVRDNWGSVRKTAFKENVVAELKNDLRREAYRVLEALVVEVVNENKPKERIEEKLRYAVDDIENRLSDSVLNGKLDKMVDARIKERLGLK